MFATLRYDKDTVSLERANSQAAQGFPPLPSLYELQIEKGMGDFHYWGSCEQLFFF